MALSFIALATSMHAIAASDADRTFISIGTGGPTGVYFVVGNAVCRLVHKEAAEGRKVGRKHGIRCSAPSTGGSTYNIGQLDVRDLDFAAVHELTSTEQSKALCDGRIDAFGYLVGVPDSGVAIATDGCGARIVSLRGPELERLVERFPCYALATIPENTYASLRKPVSTFGVLATLVTSADLDSAMVNEVVRAVFANFEDFKAMHPAFYDLDPQRMLRDGLSAPLHPGALKYC